MRILLDTCTFLWITTEDAQLSERARTLFQTPDNEIFLSSVSAWEIGVKHALGRLPLADDPSELVPRMRRDHEIESLALQEEASLQVTRLPALHRDPFDRMLVCQAILHDLTILTPDKLIRQYPVKTKW